LPRTSVSKKDA